MTYNVAILGASNNPERYSYKALVMLKEAGYPVFPVHPSEKLVNGIECYNNLSSVNDSIDTITVYLSEKNSTPLIDDIINIHPRRVILNPGAENETLNKRCKEAGIQVLEACTLVLIRTGQF